MKKKELLRWIKFYFIPFLRDHEFTYQEAEEAKIRSKRKFFSMFLYPLIITGFIFLFFIAILAVFPQWITNYSLKEVTIGSFTLAYKPPGFVCYGDVCTYHLLGTTEHGYDIFARLIWGARSALTMGFSSNFIATFGGIVIGLMVAYFGGKVDMIVMRIFDVIETIPGFIFTLFIIGLIGTKIEYILMAWGVLGIPGSARFMRALVFQVRENVYVKAAKVGGANNFKVMFKHILPNAISPIIVSFFGSLGGAVLALAGLSYVGFGDVTISDWGTDIFWAQSHFRSAPWASLWPGLLIAMTVLAFMLIGDGLRDALDPRLRK